MMKRLTLLLCFLVSLSCPKLFPQSRAESKNSFYDAESWILFEAYRDALPIFLQLNQKYPDNANYKYRIGQCYLNIPGDKEKSVPFLENAVQQINPKYREGKFSEKGAPYEALYYLANAYRINNQLDKALETYISFKEVLDPAVYDTTVVNKQMETCFTAKNLIEKPDVIIAQNLGDVINEGSSEFNPVVSDDENLIVYSKSEPFYDALLYSVKENGHWTEPKNLNEILKVDRDIFPTSLSSDGKMLYLYSSADYDGIIYTSKFENDTWLPPVKLNDNINTKFWESHATVSHDDKKLYFTSNRTGSYGGLDIYVSKKDTLGDWGPAVNLGPVINTKYNEESPFLSKDDKTLYFSSRGHHSMGGYDIFYSDMEDNGQWSEPVNAGYPLNTTDDDVFFKPSVDKYRGFYSMESPDGQGKRDIYQVEFYAPDRPRKFTVIGKASVEGMLGSFKDSIRLTITKVGEPGATKVVYTDPGSQMYKFNISQGEYQLTYEGYGGEKITRNIDLPLTYPSDSFIIPETELPRTDFTADLSVEGNKKIFVTKGDSLLIPLKVEPQSFLSVENWSGNSMISFEKHLINASEYIVKIAPVVGQNRVTLRLADRFDNSATDVVIITRASEKSHERVVRPEYSNILSRKQISAYLALMKNRADEDMLKLITESGFEKKDFSHIDDLLVALKKEGSKTDIQPLETDKLALRIALMDNVLTQASVSLLAQNSDEGLGKILSGLDIDSANLKTWTDLQLYVEEKSSGTIRSKAITELAYVILGETDPAIGIIREKILAFGEVSDKGAILRKAVSATDSADIKLRGKWVESFYSESVKGKIMPDKLAEMLVILSKMPDTDTEHYLNMLTENSDEPLTASLRSLDTRKERIKSPEDLVMFLLRSENQVKYPGDKIFKALANLISSENIPSQIIKTQVPVSKPGGRWILWLIAGALAVSVSIFWIRNRKKGK